MKDHADTRANHDCRFAQSKGIQSQSLNEHHIIHKQSEERHNPWIRTPAAGKRHGNAELEESGYIDVTVFDQAGFCEAMDLRLPLDITPYALIRRLQPWLGEIRHSRLYQLKIVNKGILLNQRQRLREAHASDGDIIQILEG